MSVQDLGITERLVIFQNGLEVIDFLNKLLNKETQEKLDENQDFYQPVSLVLLDINMPIMNGLEALKQIKEQYANINKDKLVRPMICYLTQLNYANMRNFISPEEEPDCYLEKPLPFNELSALFELLELR